MHVASRPASPAPAGTPPAYKTPHTWRPLAGQLDVVCVDRTTSDATPHLHDEFQLSLVRRPTVSTDAHGQAHHAPPRALLLVNPFDVHGDGPLPGAGWSMREMHVGADVLAGVYDGLSAGAPAPSRRAAPWFPTRVVRDTALSDVLNAFCAETRASETHDAAPPPGSARPIVPAEPLERESRLLRWLSVLVAYHAQRPPALSVGSRREHGVHVARDYLHAHSHEQVVLADLARAAGMSKYYLVHAFQREFGLPPHAYHLQLRLERARHLIEQGDSLSSVAYDVGFVDQSHLTRRFKELFGVPPGVHARSVARRPIAH